MLASLDVYCVADALVVPLETSKGCTNNGGLREDRLGRTTDVVVNKSMESHQLGPDVSLFD